MAGFLLTAVPSWTNQRGYAGAPLAALVLLWLAGRVVMSIPLGLAPLWAGIIDLAFLPALALMLLPALLRSGNRRNLVFIGLLALLFASNLHFHLNAANSIAPLFMGLNAMMFVLTLLGGRVVPAFTSAALKQLGNDIRIRRCRRVTAGAAAGPVAGAQSLVHAYRLGAACRFRLAAGLAGDQVGNPVRRGHSGHRLAARAHRGRDGHHDYRYHEPCGPGPYRAPAGDSRPGCGCLLAVDAGGVVACVRAHAGAGFALADYCRTVMVPGILTVSFRIRADSCASAD
jgi:hypothetical protein